MPTVSQRYGQTDGRTTYDSNTALALRASRGKNCQKCTKVAVINARKELMSGATFRVRKHRFSIAGGGGIADCISISTANSDMRPSSLTTALAYACHLPNGKTSSFALHKNNQKCRYHDAIFECELRKMRLRPGLRPDPIGGVYSVPQTPR